MRHTSRPIQAKRQARFTASTLAKQQVQIDQLARDADRLHIDIHSVGSDVDYAHRRLDSQWNRILDLDEEIFDGWA